MKWESFIGHAAYVASMVITLAVVLVFRFAASRMRRRSPLHGKQIGHLPGQQLHGRIDAHRDNASLGIDVMMAALPSMFLIWATQRLDWTRLRFGPIETIFVIGWIVFFAFGFQQYQRHHRRFMQAKDGLLAERVTGMQLNRLVAQGCTVMHDLPADAFNIDHVVIAPRGVYAVETKSFRKPRGSGAANARVAFDGQSLRFPDFVQTAAVAQAERQARWLAEQLNALLGGKTVPVIAALALPGWYIEQTPEVWRSAAVKVFTPMGDGCAFMTKGPVLLEDGERQLLARALALRYPRIAD